jgi:mono/diheme cytochrome c family protein
MSSCNEKNRNSTDGMRRIAAGVHPQLVVRVLTLGVFTLCCAEVFAAPISPEINTFFTQHCLRCHGAKKAEGDLRLDRLPVDFDTETTFDAWHDVLDRIRSGEMPPEKEPRPPQAEADAVVRAITRRLDEAATALKAEGRVVLRRLNRTEYENTIRALFAVDTPLKEILPEDAVSQGFDNIGAALNISPVLMERYLEAADVAISAAVAPLVASPSKVEVNLLAESLPAWFGGTYDRKQDIVLFRDGPTFVKSRARETGRYKVRISTSAYQSAVPVTFAVLAGNFNTANGSARYLGFFDALPGEPRVLELETRLAKRETIKVAPATLPRVYLKADIEQYPGPGLAVGPIEIEGPLPAEWPTESYRRVFGDVDPKQATLADAEKLLRAFLPRAFRRPTTDDEVRPYLAIVAKSLDDGLTFEEALRGGYKSILCSPHFLYLREPPGPLDDFALASRLSYFLWSGPPDQTLWTLAESGKLRAVQVLHEQVERMLQDPRGAAFTENFLGQWLNLRNIDANFPDTQLYPEFDKVLEWSMVQETQAFFNELLKSDASLLNLVDSDFAMINDRLARHYDIPGIEGIAIRKVPLKPEYHRGGLLTQASVLKVTANGTTTSPVVRGVWVMDRIIGKPVPPPPANVPAIEPDIRGATTIREQLAKHREIASCGACHSKIDPPGFALESYDVIGGYRERYRALGLKDKVKVPDVAYIKYLAKPNYGWGPAVEAGDQLPDGRKFATIEEFKQLLLANPDDFAHCLAEKLMVYATGSGLEYGDREKLNAIVTAVRSKGYGLRTLVHAIVASETFRTK